MSEQSVHLRWAPRVREAKLRQLYAALARGIVDSDLVDDVGMTLLMRCLDILAVDEARRGRVRCPACYEGGTVHVLVGGATLLCQRCGWTASWEAFAPSHKRKQLNPGGALGVFEAYVHAYPGASDPMQRMVLIDRLIHEFHYSLRPTLRSLPVQWSPTSSTRT